MTFDAMWRPNSIFTLWQSLRKRKSQCYKLCANQALWIVSLSEFNLGIQTTRVVIHLVVGVHHYGYRGQSPRSPCNVHLQPQCITHMYIIAWICGCVPKTNIQIDYIKQSTEDNHSCVLNYTKMAAERKNINSYDFQVGHFRVVSRCCWCYCTE